MCIIYMKNSDSTIYFYKYFCNNPKEIDDPQSGYGWHTNAAHTTFFLFFFFAFFRNKMNHFKKYCITLYFVY